MKAVFTIQSDGTVNVTKQKREMRLYHHSATENRESIRASGLLCSKSHHVADGGMGAIYFSTKPLLQPGFDIWEVEDVALQFEPDQTTDWPCGEQWLVTYDNVPATSLRLVR